MNEACSGRLSVNVTSFCLETTVPKSLWDCIVKDFSGYALCDTAHNSGLFIIVLGC